MGLALGVPLGSQLEPHLVLCTLLSYGFSSIDYPRARVSQVKKGEMGCYFSAKPIWSIGPRRWR